MRVLHVVFTPRYSGAEILVRDLARIHAETGYDVAVAALDPADDSFYTEIRKSERTRVKWFLPSKKSARVTRILRLRSWINKYDPDVIVAHSAIPALEVRIAQFFRHRIPVIHVLHAVDDYQDRKLRLLERTLQFGTDSIVAVSANVAENYKSRFQNSKPIHIIENGIDLDNFTTNTKERNGYRKSLGAKMDTKIILQVGRIAPVKRQHLTLAAFEQIVQTHQGVELWFAGGIEDSEYANLLASSAKRESLDSHTKFLGPRGDIAGLLAVADVFVMPSEREAYAISLVEALASGVPIIATDLPNTQYASVFEGVELIDPSNIDLYKKGICSALITNSRYSRDVSAFSLENTAMQYRELIKSTARKQALSVIESG